MQASFCGNAWRSTLLFNLVGLIAKDATAESDLTDTPSITGSVRLCLNHYNLTPVYIGKDHDFSLLKTEFPLGKKWFKNFHISYQSGFRLFWELKKNITAVAHCAGGFGGV